MGLRKAINEKPGLVISFVLTVCVVCGSFMFLRLFGDKPNPQAAYARKVFFSDDDGKTWFLDNVSNLAPFDHNGRQAYRAAVYRCGGGKPFVAYLQRYPSSQLAQVKAAVANSSNGPPVAPPPSFSMEIKKPGGSEWLAPNAAGYQKLMHPRCPDGSANPTPLQPSDPDSQVQ